MNIQDIALPENPSSDQWFAAGELITAGNHLEMVKASPFSTAAQIEKAQQEYERRQAIFTQLCPPPDLQPQLF